MRRAAAALLSALAAASPADARNRAAVQAAVGAPAVSAPSVPAEPLALDALSGGAPAPLASAPLLETPQALPPAAASVPGAAAPLPSALQEIAAAPAPSEPREAAAPRVGSPEFQRALQERVAAPTQDLLRSPGPVERDSSRAGEPFEGPARRGEPAPPVFGGGRRSSSSPPRLAPPGERDPERPPEPPRDFRGDVQDAEQPPLGWLRSALLAAAIGLSAGLPAILYSRQMDAVFRLKEMTPMFGYGVLDAGPFWSLFFSGVLANVLTTPLLAWLFPQKAEDEDAERVYRELTEKPVESLAFTIPFSNYVEEMLFRFFALWAPIAALVWLFPALPAAAVFVPVSMANALGFGFWHRYDYIWTRVFAALLLNALLAVTGSLLLVFLVHYASNFLFFWIIRWQLARADRRRKP